MTTKAFTALGVSTIKKVGFHRDALTKGLYLQVRRSGSGVSRSWDTGRLRRQAQPDVVPQLPHL